MASAFKLYPADETATGGEYGTSPYGDESYGGVAQGTKLVLPPNEVGGDDPTREDHWLVGESTLRRSGKLLGARVFDTWRIWDFEFSVLRAADLDNLKVYFLARRFKFIPESTEEETFFETRWLGTAFQPTSRRGSFYGIGFSIEEIG